VLSSALQDNYPGYLDSLSDEDVANLHLDMQ